MPGAIDNIEKVDVEGHDPDKHSQATRRPKAAESVDSAAFGREVCHTTGIRYLQQKAQHYHGSHSV